jgi:catechol 2,3-dioxygenase-like lactoylglutathione lyase family enzyme
MSQVKRAFQGRGIMHVSLVVSDLRRARAFYEGILGLIPIKRPADLSFPGVWYFLGPQELHLIEARDTNINPLQHVAIEVTDVRAAKAVLQAHKIQCVSELRAGAGGFHSIYCYDPDGNRIELCQPIGFGGMASRSDR